MKGLAPAFYMTVCASSGAASAAVFYEGCPDPGVADPVAPRDSHPAGIQPVHPSAACKFSVQRRNAWKNGRISEHSDLLGTQNTPRGSWWDLQIIRNLVAPVMDNLKRGTSRAGRQARFPVVGNAVKHGHRTGRDKCSPDPQLPWCRDPC